MPYKFTATIDYINSEQKIKTLISFATKEGKKGNDDNRILFLKLGVVLLVTRFQVYVEKILDEFNTAYRVLHLEGYYDGERNYSVIQSGLESVIQIINKIKPIGTESYKLN